MAESGLTDQKSTWVAIGLKSIARVAAETAYWLTTVCWIYMKFLNALFPVSQNMRRGLLIYDINDNLLTWY